MKNILLICLSLFCFSFLGAQGIQFFEGSWKEALAEAKKQNKPIFVDAYAVWCGPCKRMAKTVFTNEEVGKFYNEHFINLKLDMEKAEGGPFRSKYPVSAYPTLYYIDFTGETILRMVGGQSVEGFIETGRNAIKKIDRSGQYAEAYKNGDRSPELVFNYVKALNQAGKSSLRVANDYLKSQDDLTTEANLKFVLEAVSSADSRIFDLMIQHRKKIEVIAGKETVNDKILGACEMTAQKAIEFQSKELMKEAKDKMKKHYPEEAAEFAISKEMAFCLAMRETSHYLKACKNYAKKVANNEPKELNSLAQSILQHFKQDAEAMKQAEDFAKAAAEKGNHYKYYMTYAYILNEAGKKDAAMNAAEKSLKLSKSIGPRATRTVEMMIKRIGG